MPLLTAGHKRTGACPTFDRPVLQRDGYLLRVALVGGVLTGSQAHAVGHVSATRGGSTIELTNRGNLQLRGVREADVPAALDALRDVGLGAADAALVTISPFAGRREHELRSRVLRALDVVLADGPPLSPKFVVHVDDAHGWTAERRAEAVLRAAGGSWQVRIPGLGQQPAGGSEAVAATLAIAEACRADGDQSRVADLVVRHGADAVRAALPQPSGWTPVDRACVPAVERLGPASGPGGSALVLAGARLGRIDPATLVALVDRVERMPGASLRVTPWRSFAVVLPAGEQASAAAVAHDLAGLGLIVDPSDPAAGVVACIGAAGCWQTEADTHAEADRQIARRALDGGGGTLHVTGCDKRCATRAPVAVTLLGRSDGSGFDEVVS